MADLPAIRITAVDASGPAFASATRAIGGFAAQVLSFAAVFQSVRKSLDLGDELKHMQDTLGLSIGKLDQLSIIAKLNNADLGDMAKSFKALRGSMIESQNQSSQSAKLFQAMGVQVRDLNGNLRNVDDVLTDTAKALDAIGDENVKAAAGTAIFGKSYQQIAATLRNYADDQEKANKVLELYGGVSQTAANLSDELGDKFTLLGEGSKRAFLLALVPGLAAVSQMLSELIDKGGAFQTGFGKAVSDTATFVAGSIISLAGAFQVLGSVGRFLNADITEVPAAFRKMRDEISKIETDVKAAQARIATSAKFPGLDDGDQSSRAAAAQARIDEFDRLKWAQADAAKMAALLKALAGPQKAVADGQSKLLEESAKFLNSLLEQEAALGATQAELLAYKAAELGVTDAAKPLIAAIETKRVKLQAEKDATEKVVKALEADEAWMKKDEAARQSATDEAEKFVEQLELELEALKMTDEQRALSIALRQLEKDKINLSAEALAQYRARVVSAVESKAALEQQINLWEGIEGAAHDAFLHIGEGGKAVFDRLTDALKSGLLELLYQMTVKKWIIQIGTEITGNAGLLGGVAGSGGGGGLGGLLNLGSSLASSAGGGLASIFGASGFTAGLAGDAFLPGALGAAGLGEAGILASFGSSLGPLMAAAPWAAIGAIAIPLVAKLFDKGPASRTGTFASGPASLVADKSRDEVFQGKSAFGSFGIAKDFWLGPEAGASFKPTLDAITQLDNTIARMVGGDLTKEITDALAEHSITVGLGKEGTDINASGGPGQILKDRYVTVLSAIDAELGALVENFDGTGEELAQFVVGLVSMHTTLADAAGGFSDLMAELDKAKDPTILDAFRKQGEEFDRLLETYDGSASATSNLTSATQGYYQSLVALIVQIKEVQKAVDTMFADTRESVFLAGRDDQFVYDFLRQQADDKAATLGSLSDPAAIQALAAEINDNINRAFGLLDDEGKNAKRDEFLQGIDNINAAVTQRLAEVQGNATGAAQSDIGQVKDLLTSFLAGQKATVDKNDAAVDKFAVAVEQMVTTPIPIMVEGGYSAVGGT